MKEHDCIIIGGQTAALSAAIYAARSALDTLVLAGYDGQTASIAEIENYPGVFPAVSGIDFVETMRMQAEHFGAVIVHAVATSIDRVNGDNGHRIFTVCTRKTQGGNDNISTKHYTRTVIIATGAKRRHLGVAGETELFGKGVSYCAVCDGPFFRGKRIVVVGGGDSALSEALHLSSLSPHIVIVHRRETFRADESLQCRVRKNSAITTAMSCVVKEIRGDGCVQSVLLEDTVTRKMREEPCDAVFVSVGSDPATELVDFLQKDSGGYIITDNKMRTACDGLFVAGDVRATPLRQVVTAASDGAVAAHSAAEYVHNMAR